ncbi:hypothetical protein [Phenylobacterium sp.]|uniref:hypothetical protein n=1 Tax=Phenylobacterium sp. TaxID=1871053 RepID=UPI0027354B0A|nr:hypothetical protein [Phenylobacterium sp.]MDP3632222.1 hypothetical protein [Phenylobacterium sp.]MDZ4054242.1 hypothetical protein [Phenylobacterium sp.]
MGAAFDVKEEAGGYGRALTASMAPLPVFLGRRQDADRLKKGLGMTFTKKLREPIIRGEICCSVRIWRAPRVKVGGRYRLGDGAVEVMSLRQIELTDITPQLARDSGFEGVVDLLKTAKHGLGDKVYLVDFEYRPDTTF